MSTIEVRQPSTLTGRGVHRWVGRHPVASYVVLAYAFSWLAWVPWVLGNRDGVGAVLLIVGGFGPAVSAAAITWAIGDSVRSWARQILRWRVAPRYYVYALGLPALLFGLMNVELAALGHEIDVGTLRDRAPAYLGTLVFVALIGGGFEEPGWRGFALPRLQGRHAPIKATLLLGLAWGVWHVPLYGPLGFAVPLILAFFYTWLYNRTGSVLLCILLHGSFTPALDQLILLPDDGRGVAVVDVVIVVTLAAAVGVLIVATRGRLGFDAIARKD